MMSSLLHGELEHPLECPSAGISSAKATVGGGKLAAQTIGHTRYSGRKTFLRNEKNLQKIVRPRIMDTSLIRSSKGGSNGQVEYSTEEGGEPERGEAGTRDQAKNTPQRSQAAASQGRQE